MTSHALNDLIRDKIDGRWSEWSAGHPHLADAIDRIRLVESTAAQLREDPEYIQAMRAADLDEAGLIAAERILGRIEQAVQKVLPL